MARKLAEVKAKRQAIQVWRASYCDMVGTVSIIGDTVQFLSDDGQVLRIDLPHFCQHGACEEEVSSMTVQALRA